MTIPNRPGKWTPPPARILGDRLLREQKERAMQQTQQTVAVMRRVEDLHTPGLGTPPVDDLTTQVEKLQDTVERLADNLPKMVIGGGGGGRRTVTKVIERDYPGLADIGVYANQGEAEAGTVTDKLMNPLRTKQAIDIRYDELAALVQTTMEAALAALKRTEFAPEVLFTNGEKGFYFDANAIGTLWQDTAATTAAVSDGAVIKRINLKYPGGGAGGNFEQSTTGNAPLLTVDSTLGSKAVRLDGVDNFMTAAGVDLDGISKLTMVLALSQKSQATGIVLEHGTSTTNSGGFTAIVNNGGQRKFGAGAGGPGNYLYNDAFAVALPTTYVATVIIDPAAATADDRIRIRIDGVDVNETQAAAAGTVADTTAFDTRAMYLGARAGASIFANVDIAGAIILGRGATEDEIVSAERWAAACLAPIYPFSLRPIAFSDSHTPVDDGVSVEPSPFAGIELDTLAGGMVIEGISYLAGNYLGKLGVYVDGEHHASLTFSALVQQHVVELPVGRKIVSIIAGPTTGASESVSVGTSVLKIRADAAIEQVNVGEPSDIVVYGDSISVGDSCVIDVMKNAWALQVRRAAYAQGMRLAVEGRGIRSLHEDCVDGTARAAFVAKIVAYNPSKIWLAIGTNDWGINKWSAASFGTAYAALLDDLHTALPSAHIWCQTPLTRGGETSPNGNGSTLPDYRAQIATAVATRTAFANLVLGPSILSYPADFYDGTHPDDDGSTVYADFVNGVLNL